jgi:ubiquinone/menaquinone biosynthesis C-methylase UbiE
MIGLVEDIMTDEVGIVYPDYDSMVLEDDKPYRSARGWDYDAIAHYGEFQNTDILLDIGGACSYFFIYLCKHIKESWCIDPIYSYAERWAVPWLKSLKHYSEYTSGRARLVIQNAEKLPFEDSYFDKVITCSAMEHFEGTDDISCVIEIRRVLKPNGLFVGTVDFNWFNEYIPEKYGEARFYNYQSLYERIIIPSGLKLLGKDHLMDKIMPDISVYPDQKNIIQAVFFALKKE